MSRYLTQREQIEGSLGCATIQNTRAGDMRPDQSSDVIGLLSDTHGVGGVHDAVV